MSELFSAVVAYFTAGMVETSPGVYDSVIQTPTRETSVWHLEITEVGGVVQVEGDVTYLMTHSGREAFSDIGWEFKDIAALERHKEYDREAIMEEEALGVEETTPELIRQELETWNHNFLP